MLSSGNNQPSNETPILHIDTATLQAAVAAAVTTFLTHINSGNTSKTDKGVESLDGSTKPGNQQIVTVTGSQSRKTENKKRKRQAQKERKKSQRLAMQQQQVETLGIPVPSRPYEGKIPKCEKCSFHHHWAYHEMQCCNCLNIRHHAHYCLSLIHI